jgi:flavorubredoxin
MFTYVREEKLLITSDVFGCHYYNENTVFDADESKGLLEAQDYYYHVIMHPYRTYVEPMLKKIERLDIAMLGPAHGPIIKNHEAIIIHYKEWTKDVGVKKDPKKAVITYVSAYGFTRTLAKTFEQELQKAGFDVKSLDAQDTPADEILTAIDGADALLFGSPTFTRDALPPIWNILSQISAVAYRNRPACAFGSYGWSGEGTLNITARLKQLGFKIIDPYRVRLKPSEAEIQGAREYIKEFIGLVK